jgi:plasmid maintenance system antidote protein VapI
MPDDKFRPRWASPPGDTIRTALTERHLSLAALGESLRLSPARVQAILTGTEALSIDIAQRLTRLIGGSVAFWMNRDCQFRDDLARIEARHWSAQFPTKQAAAFGWIPPPDRTTEALDAWLEFFDVPDVDTWQHEYLSVIRTAKFRTAAPTTVDQPAVAAWLRQAEITASRIEANPWRPAAFRQVLSDARPLTRQKDPRSFVAQPTFVRVPVSRLRSFDRREDVRLAARRAFLHRTRRLSSSVPVTLPTTNSGLRSSTKQGTCCSTTQHQFTSINSTWESRCPAALMREKLTISLVTCYSRPILARGS